MPTNFQRPTLATLLDRAKSDFESAVAGVTARLALSIEEGLTDAIAGVADGLHGHLAWVAEQILPDRAAESFVLRWGDLLGVYRLAATAAAGPLNVTGTGTIPAGTEYVRVADGWLYTVDSEVVVSTSDTVQLTAKTGHEGADGNIVAGQTLQLVSEIAGIDSEGVVGSGGIIGGADQETLSALLVRILDRMSRPPMGGAPGDHVTWMKDSSSSVTRAWEFAGQDGTGNPGLGKIAVTWVYDGRPSIVPTAGELTAMQSYLDARSPFEVIVFAPTLVAFDWTDVLTPNGVASVEAAVEAEVADMLLRDGEPGGTIYLSRLHEAISAAAGETSHTITSPAADVTHDFGELPELGTPTHN